MAVLAPGIEPTGKRRRFPGKDGGSENSSEAQRPELLQERDEGEPGRLPGAVTGNFRARQALAQRRQGAAQGRHGGRCIIQVVKPAAEGGGIGHAVGILEGGRSRFPAAAFHKTPVQGLPASLQTVVRVREGEGRQQGEGLAAFVTDAAAYPDKVVVFIVSLLAAPAVTDDRVVLANRASS